MRIVYYSIPPFADSDFPLIKALRHQGHEVYYIVRLAPFFAKTTLLAFDKIRKQSDILLASAYPELSEWGDWIDLDRTFISNDCVGRTSLASVRLFFKEMRFIASLKPDVLHYVSVPFIPHLLLLLSHKRRSVCVIHDPIPHSGEDSFRDRVKRRGLAMLGTKIVLLNDLNTDMFCSRYGFKRNKVFYSTLGPYECYRKFRTNRVFDAPYIILFGRMSPYKGIDHALEAMDAIHDSFPDVKLIVAGSGPICFDWDKYSHKGFAELINRYLTMSEIADYVGNALFCVCPYTDATQSGVLQTSFALGTPAVVTAVGTMPRIVKDGVNGLVVPPSDPSSLSEAFCKLLGNRELLDTMRMNIKNEYESGKGSWYEIANQYVSIYGAGKHA